MLPDVLADALPDPEDLWWSWVVLAALHRAAGDDRCWFDAQRHTLCLELDSGAWLRMQRVLGTRFTLWGRSNLAPTRAPDACGLAPDWAVTQPALEDRPSFVAWHAHGEWDTSSPGIDEGAAQLLGPLLSVDPRAVEAAREGRADPQTLSSWTEGQDLTAAADLVVLATETEPTIAPLGAVHLRLRDQVHQQMRDAAEAQRPLLQRPPALVRWLRVHEPPAPFEYAVMARRDQVVPARRNTVLTKPAERSLVNVLTAQHRDEAHEESGAWLFARVSSDGTSVRFQRAFDSWPSWYQVPHSGTGPSLEELAWEMDQRTAAWRPLWASLLPVSDAR